MKPWPTKPLGALVDFVGGGTPRRDRPDYWGGGIPWASVKDLQSQLLETTIETITSEGLANSASNLIPAGTVIIASRVGLGKVAINRKPVAINQDLKALTPLGGELLPRFLLLFLLSNADYFERAGVGATVKGLTIADYQKLRIPVPLLAEQERIVKLLDEADELRKLRAQADRRTAALLPALFHEMFGDPGFLRLSLKEIAAKQRNSLANGPFGSDLLSSELTDAGVPVIYIRDISSGAYERKNTVFVTPSKAAKLEFCNVIPGDVLVAKVGTPPGIAAVYPASEPQAIVTQDVIRLRPNLELSLPVYLEGFLNSAMGQWEVRNITIQATRQRFSLGQFRKIKVPVPPLPLQKEFAQRVTEIRALEAAQAASRLRLENLFQSMLHRAFNGEL